MLLTSPGCGMQPHRAAADSSSAHEALARVINPTPAQLQRGEALAASYLVTFRPRLGEANQGLQGFAGEQVAHVAYLDRGFTGDPRVKQLRFLSAVDLHQALDPNPGGAAALTMPRYLKALTASNLSPAPQIGSLAQVDFSSPEAAKELLEEWDGNGDLWFAEPNYISHLNADPATSLFSSYATKYREQSYWWTNLINLPEAFSALAARDQKQTSGRTDQQILDHRPIVAVFDSGVDYLHPGLAQHIWTNADPNVAGCTNDIHGCNTTVATRDRLGNGDVWPYDANGPATSCTNRDPNCGHGTHVAGIIAGDAGWTDPVSREFAAGVCPVCQIMILRIVGKVGTSSGILDSSIIAAFKYISLFRRNGQPAVRVVNASFGKFTKSRAVNLLLQTAKEQNGTLVIAAAGNEDSSTPEYPAAFSDAIAVTAVDSTLRKLPFSNFGPWVSLAAPGESILSTIPGGALEWKSGTSMASPMVAGTAGLLLAKNPTLSFAELRATLLSSADPALYSPTSADGFNRANYFPYLSGQSGRVPLLGSGVLNAKAAVMGTVATVYSSATRQNRVRPGCAVIGSQTAAKGNILALAMLLPMILALIKRPGRR